MLIAASALGAGIAGLILYYKQKSKKTKQINGNAVHPAGNGLEQLVRPAHHAMG